MRRSALFGLGILSLACGGDEPARTNGADTLAARGASPSARADLRTADGRSLGVVTFQAGEGGVTLSGDLQGLPPGEHGFHIHAVGACQAPGFESAGGHLALAGQTHGFDAMGGPHAGDLRNLVADPDGRATVDQTNDRASLATGSTALLDADGSALVVHVGPDDGVSQPSGAAGARLACGVIERSP